MDNKEKLIEKYLTRYLIGTLCAALMLLATKPLMPAPYAELVKLDNTEHSILFVLLAFLVCYIGSAPALVLYATRACFVEEVSFKGRYIIILLTAVVSSGISIFIMRLWHAAWLESIWLAMVVTFIAVQIAMVTIVGYLRRENAKYYKSLSEFRNSQNGDLVDSYRMLREHGNAMLIVANEVLFFLMLCGLAKIFSVRSETGLYLLLGCVMLFWISPAVIVYGIAIRLEVDLVNRDYD